MTDAVKPRPSRKTAIPPALANKPAVADLNLPGKDRQAMVAQAAFFIAEARGFAPGQEFDDWLAAERMLGQQPDSSGN